MAKKNKKRLDTSIVDLGLAPEAAKAGALVMAGRVRVDGVVADKPGTLIGPSALIELSAGKMFVGRGGVKLFGALDEFGMEVTGLVAMDVGSSTGGFTDCLLKRGAAFVFAVDVGRGLIDAGLRKDGRVKVLEGRNIRHLEFEEVGRKVDLVVIDVSFISLEKVLPEVRRFLKDGAGVLALVKPQFEAPRKDVGKGGVVIDEGVRRAALERVRSFAETIGYKAIAECVSPITGAKGNKEFWLRLSA